MGNLLLVGLMFRLPLCRRDRQLRLCRKCGQGQRSFDGYWVRNEGIERLLAKARGYCEVVG